MKNLKMLYLLLICFFSILATLPNECMGNEDEFEEVEFEKVYVKPSELVIDDDGIYLIRSNEVLPLRAVFADINGLFFRVAKKPSTMGPDVCGNGHDRYHGCGGCAMWDCNFRCKCFSPFMEKPGF